MSRSDNERGEAVIKSLTINRYRNTRPCTLRFDPQLTVVLGRNRTGRSELLSLVWTARHGLSYTWTDTAIGMRKIAHDTLAELTSNSPVDTFDDWLDGCHYSTVQEEIERALQPNEQRIITTMSPWLVDVLPIDDVAQLQRRIILTSRDGDEFVWRNLTADEAARVARSLANNIMQFSEILRAEGLW